MAKAKTFTRKITRKITRKVVEQVPGYVELNLTPEEATYLRTLVGHHVIGSGKTREINDSIYNALYEAGVRANRSLIANGYLTVKDANNG